jgi:hypothetical protein
MNVTTKGFTINEVRESTWGEHRLSEVTAFEIIEGEYGPEINGITLDELLDKVDRAKLRPSETRSTLPDQIGEWRRALGLPGVYALEKATKQLSGESRLNLVSSWFNGAGGLPRPKTGPGHLRDRVSLYLGHPSLLNEFILWLISYLGVHTSVDARVFPDCERVINVCRGIRGESPVIRY